ncbi:MAG TPA: hypothetical protein VFK86_16605, partial [Bauldia sp.]|nr:hypothetical protein [Bauldia sp.]
RRQQERLLAALDAARVQLRRDEAGWWIITGRRGTIHTWGDGETWGVYVRCRSRQHWTFTKRRLAFMTVTQDGDEEGCLRLFRLPMPEEAVLIRDVTGLRKRVDYAPDTLERKRASMAKAGLARETARASMPDVAMPEEVFGHFPAVGGLTVEGAEILDVTAASDRDPQNRKRAASDASHARPIAAGVNGRFRGQGLATAPGLAPDTTPIPSPEKTAAIAPINAVAVTEPKEVA